MRLKSIRRVIRPLNTILYTRKVNDRRRGKHIIISTATVNSPLRHHRSFVARLGGRYRAALHPQPRPCSSPPATAPSRCSAAIDFLVLLQTLQVPIHCDGMHPVLRYRSASGKSEVGAKIGIYEYLIHGRKVKCYFTGKKQLKRTNLRTGT